VQPYFEPVPHDPRCRYCRGQAEVTALPELLDSVYCISLQEQPHRTAQAAAHFHRVGLCRHVTFYRPARGAFYPLAVWDSHRAVACEAVRKRCRAALILEDDVYFFQSWEKLARRIQRALAALPVDWRTFYLGHIPFQAYFTRRDILRVRSGLAHAYIANRRMLDWLARTEPLGEEVATWRRVGCGIDGAMAELSDMYALFPMAAVQRFLDRGIDDRRTALQRCGTQKYMEHMPNVIAAVPRAAEVAAVALSPFHRLTLERCRQQNETKVKETTQLIRSSGLFDGEFYLRRRPDVADLKVSPLWHYRVYGAREGMWPCPLFDPSYYATQSHIPGRENPLVQYIRQGSAQHRKPHALFDSAFYVARYGNHIPPGMLPLAHFLAIGGQAGFDPLPLFDSSHYLSQRPHLKSLRQNPLIDYLNEGWREGASPHPSFNGASYLQSNPDAQAAGINPLEHFVRCGQRTAA
jgi:GR25 family glycosyltransferase involved in LPS biosynthesis